MTSTFSGDPADFAVLSKELAAPALLRTGLLSRESNVAKMRRRKARLQQRLRQEEAGEPVSSEDEYSSEELAGEDDAARIRKALLTCRVLHWGANKVPLDGDAAGAAVYQPKSVNAKKKSALREVKKHRRGGAGAEEAEQGLEDVAFSSKMMVAQIHLKNCALALFSRYHCTQPAQSPDPSPVPLLATN